MAGLWCSFPKARAPRPALRLNIKPAAFVLAIATNAPIVPIALNSGRMLAEAFVFAVSGRN